MCKQNDVSIIRKVHNINYIYIEKKINANIYYETNRIYYLVDKKNIMMTNTYMLIIYPIKMRIKGYEYE